MAKSRLVLLDANVVILLFELGIWEHLAKRVEIILAKSVVDESQYYRENDLAIEIDLCPSIESELVTVIEVPLSSIAKYRSRFGASYVEKFDAGETESLCLLEEHKDAMICSADAIVWRVLGNLVMSERGTSLEEILSSTGLLRKLPQQFSKAFRLKWTAIGFQEKQMGLNPKN